MKVILVGYVYLEDYTSYEKNISHYTLDSHHSKHIKQYLDFVINNTDYKNIMLGSCHEEIFNIFGYFISNGRISKDDVKVVLFDENHNKTNYQYNNKGYLNIPVGFFSWN